MSNASVASPTATPMSTSERTHSFTDVRARQPSQRTRRSGFVGAVIGVVASESEPIVVGRLAIILHAVEVGVHLAAYHCVRTEEAVSTLRRTSDAQLACETVDMSKSGRGPPTRAYPSRHPSDQALRR